MSASPGVWCLGFEDSSDKVGVDSKRGAGSGVIAQIYRHTRSKEPYIRPT